MNRKSYWLSTLALGLLTTLGRSVAAADDSDSSSEELHRRCSPTDVVRSDYFVDITSTLPQYYGQPAQLHIHRVHPRYRSHRCRQRVQPAILVHGRSIDAVTAFDLQHADYSLMETMARAGIDAFAINLLGFGQSTRFGLDDPCNASTARDTPTPSQPINQQATLLIPNPLPAECEHSDGSYFMDRQAQIDQLSDVVQHVQNIYGSSTRVSLLSWSLGGFVLGAYLAVPGHQDHIRNVVFIAPPLGPIPTIPDEEPAVRPTFPLEVSDISRIDVLFQISPECPGQQDPNILQPIWDSLRQQDPLGATWGGTDPQRGGLFRWATRVLWAWNATLAGTVTVPTMTIAGDLDTLVETQPAELHRALGSASKVYLHMTCASHASVWEGSTTGSWGGPHTTVQDAVVQWMTHESYQGVSNGSFHSLADGTVVQE